MVYLHVYKLCMINARSHEYSIMQYSSTMTTAIQILVQLTIYTQLQVYFVNMQSLYEFKLNLYLVT